MLHLKHRPTSFKKMMGNSATIATLKELLQSKAKPHAFLFSGPTGCGKTTIGRIVAKELGCHGADYREINTADFRGIDTIREMRSQINFSPLESSCRVWLIDECFAKGTLVNTPKGEVKIEQLRKGDNVYSLNGVDTIKHIFVNKVRLDRIVRIDFNNGRSVYTTKEHLFFTIDGWKEAQNLTRNDLILGFNCSIMSDITLQRRSGNEDEKMQVVRGKIQTKEKDTRNMLEILCSKIKKLQKWSWKDRVRKLRMVWKTNGSDSFKKKKKAVLFPILCWKVEKFPTRNKKENVYEREKPKNINSKEKIFTTTSRSESRVQQTYEKEQSNGRSFNCKQNATNKKNKQNSACMERRSWWKRKIYGSTTDFSFCFGLAYGGGHKNRTFSPGQERFSYELQSRYREPGNENSNRSRWERTQIEKEYIERSKKDKKTPRIRVEGIEIYKQGDNDESFASIISDKERNKGYIEFYDLEVRTYPSYFVQGVPAHNCHKLTGDAQNALLKMLEEPPSHVYFILCTTEPQKLLKTVKGRCSSFVMEPLNDKQMMRLLRNVTRKEKATVGKDVLWEIINRSDGLPRHALQMLNQVLHTPVQKQIKILKEYKDEEEQIITLCRELIKSNRSWNLVRKTLEALDKQKTDPEAIRRVVLGYCKAVLLNSDNRTAAQIMEQFIDPFYDTGFPGVVFACYAVVKG